MLTPTIIASQTVVLRETYGQVANLPATPQGDVRSRSERTSPSTRHTSFRIAGRKRLQD